MLASEVLAGRRNRGNERHASKAVDRSFDMHEQDLVDRDSFTLPDGMR